MTENEERFEELKDAICRLVSIAEDAICREGFEELDNAGAEIIGCLEEIQQYRAMEQKLQSVYGEHDGLLEIIVNGLVKYENAPDKAIKTVLLTDDDVDKWEAYKAIGTVEELKTMKENGAFSGTELAQIAAMQMKLKEYQSIGTVDECRTAVVLMKPKKPIIHERKFQNGDEVCTNWKCPICGLNVIEEPLCQEYCQRCGNKLDWSE